MKPRYEYPVPSDTHAMLENMTKGFAVHKECGRLGFSHWVSAIGVTCPCSKPTLNTIGNPVPCDLPKGHDEDCSSNDWWNK